MIDITYSLFGRVERNGYKGIFLEYSIYSLFGNLVGRNGMTRRECSFHSLLSIPPKSEKNMHSFNERELKY